MAECPTDSFSETPIETSISYICYNIITGSALLLCAESGGEGGGIRYRWCEWEFEHYWSIIFTKP